MQIIQLAMRGTIEESLLESQEGSRQRQKGQEVVSGRGAAKRAREREEGDDGRQAAMLNGLKLLRLDY